MPFDADKLGERLMLSRRRLGWTQRQLAEASGVRTVTVTRIERGRMPHVSLDVVYRLAEALGASLDYLAGMHEEPEAR